MGARTRGFANNVLTAGKIDASDGLTGNLPNSNVNNTSVSGVTSLPPSVGSGIASVSSNPAAPAATGIVWYNTADERFKVAPNLQAWSSGANLVTATALMGGAGTQTAALGFGGYIGPGTPNVVNTTLEYNGSGWALGGNLVAARSGMGGTGTQTAGLGFGGSTTIPRAPGEIASSEEYDGTSWTEGNNLNDALVGVGGLGSQTAAVAFGGGTPNTNATEHYDGTSWTNVPGTLTSARRYLQGCGTQTAGLTAGGSGTSTNEYNGTAWTAGGDMNTSRPNTGAVSGIQTSALMSGGGSGGTPVGGKTELYDGTSWSEVADMAVSRYSSAGANGGTTSASIAFGGYLGGTGYISSTEEWNDSVNVITAAAWASGGNMNTPRAENFGVSGTQTAAVAFGGYTPAPGPKATANSEEYNGTSWTEGNNLGTARWDISGAGSQTAALVAGGGTPGSTANCEEYNGTSWAEQNNLGTPGRARTSGTQTAGIVAGRKDVPGITVNCETYDGTSWTEVGNLNTARGAPQQVGNSSNALNASGTQDGIGGVVNVGNVEQWDGSSWSEVANVLDDSRSGQGAGDYNDMMLLNGSGATANGTQMWNGTAWVTGTSTPYNATGGGANGPSSAVINSGGGDADGTIEFTAETTALNVENITDS